MFDKPIVCPILIGRTAALEAIDRAIDSIREHRSLPRTLVLSGEAGLGKSRLVIEAKTRASQYRSSILQGNCFEQDRPLPYAPIIENLFVVDASIMPMIPAVSTNLATIMLAERCAAWLSGES